MRPYTESDIFQKMNNGNSVYNSIVASVKSINGNCIINRRIDDTLNSIYKIYKDALTLKVIDAIKNLKIILVVLPIDKRLPANMPYVKTKLHGEEVMVVDVSKYATVERDAMGVITSIKINNMKLYNLIVPAYFALNVLNEHTIISNETTKWMAYLWAKLFNKILITQRIFVGNQERYEAFMYFAMRFFMIYYMGTPMPIVDKISLEFINNSKSNYILTIENRLSELQIDLYSSWDAFAHSMFSNEVTNIKAGTPIEMNCEAYLRLYSSYMGRDGAYLALWSADYFFYCLFVTYNHSYILNDRNWTDIVDGKGKLMPKVLAGLMKEV